LGARRLRRRRGRLRRRTLRQGRTTGGSPPVCLPASRTLTDLRTKTSLTAGGRRTPTGSPLGAAATELYRMCTAAEEGAAGAPLADPPVREDGTMEASRARPGRGGPFPPWSRRCCLWLRYWLALG